MDTRPSLKPLIQYSKSEGGAVGGALTTLILAYGQRRGWALTAVEAGALVTIGAYLMAYVTPVVRFYYDRLMRRFK